MGEKKYLTRYVAEPIFIQPAVIEFRFPFTRHSIYREKRITLAAKRRKRFKNRKMSILLPSGCFQFILTEIAKKGLSAITIG